MVGVVGWFMAIIGVVLGANLDNKNVKQVSWHTCAVFRFPELPPEQADDHNPLPTDFHVEDNFPYSEILKLLAPSECKILRAEFDTKERDIFVKELEARVKVLWPNSSFSSVSCGNHVRESKCERAIVFSSESNDCGEWLGKWFTGCVVVFCDHKHVLA